LNACQYVTCAISSDGLMPPAVWAVPPGIEFAGARGGGRGTVGASMSFGDAGGGGGIRVAVGAEDAVCLVSSAIVCVDAMVGKGKLGM
jgi:hypothetical protein